MNTIKLSVIVILSFANQQYISSQKITAGILSGTNFSNPSGNFTSGKWLKQEGTTTGFFAGLEITPFLSIQTELNYTKQRYNLRRYKYEWQEVYYSKEPFTIATSSASSLIYFLPVWEQWDFSFLRIPLYLKLATPTRIKFEFSGGVYECFREYFDYQSEPKIVWNYNEDYYPFLPVYTGEYKPKVPKHDFGIVFSTGVSYEISDNFRIFLNGRYFQGRRNFIENNYGRTGATELTLGIGYDFYKPKREIKRESPDSIHSSIYFEPKIGVILSQNSGEHRNNSYSAKLGTSVGFSLIYKFSRNFSIESNILYERKGYYFKDSSNSYFRYYNPGYSNKVDSKVDIDYVVFPVLLNLDIWKKPKIVFSTGPYIGMLLNARATGVAYSESTGSNGYVLWKTNVYDDLDGFIKSNDVGWTFGSSIQFPFIKKYLFDIGIRYYCGFKNINEEVYGQLQNSREDRVIKNTSFNASLGFIIPIY